MSDPAPLAFYARQPQAGQPFRLLGYALILVAGWWGAAASPAAWAWLAGCAAAAWLLAWHRQVGALWRSSLVAAFLLALAQLSRVAWA